MITAKQILLLWAVTATQAANIPEKKESVQQKRALDYTYPFPIITFQEQPQKFYVETIKSVSPLGQRYLPPTGPTLPALNGPSNPPISVSFNAFEPSEQQSPSPSSKPAATTAPVVTASAAPATTPVKKRPSGGLGSFKYYGGSGASSSSKTDSSASPSTSVPASPTPTAASKSVQLESAQASQDKSAAKPASKSGPYDYPSPKNNRKPSKKEQKLADSKPEESGVGYQYEVGLPSVIGGNSAASGLSGTVSGSSGGMGLSYMRQSSPFYSFHVMLD